jgi:hypothetical protein
MDKFFIIDMIITMLLLTIAVDATGSMEEFLGVSKSTFDTFQSVAVGWIAYSIADGRRQR